MAVFMITLHLTVAIQITMPASYAHATSGPGAKQQAVTETQKLQSMMMETGLKMRHTAIANSPWIHNATKLLLLTQETVLLIPRLEIWLASDVVMAQKATATLMNRIAMTITQNTVDTTFSIPK